MLRAMPVNARSSLDLEIMITPFVLVRSGCIKRVFSMILRRSRMWKQAGSTDGRLTLRHDKRWANGTKVQFHPGSGVGRLEG